MEIAILGHMGRDEAVVDRLQSEHRIHVIGQWENPGLAQKARATGGEFYPIDSIKNTRIVADIVEYIRPDMFLTNFDDSLGAGVVDAIQRRILARQLPDILLPCPNKEAAKVEWDKFYLRELIEEIDPKYNPDHFRITDPAMVEQAIEHFTSLGKEIAIKPRNLTGGKGVKVMGKHFHTYEEGRAYALQVLDADDQTGVEIQERLAGHEFTLQLFTDGKTLIKPPATFDYPYREDGDTGPGTGGMGTFTMPHGEQLPFMTDQDYDEAYKLMEKLLDKLKERGHDYKGVLYPTFFKTAEGLKIVEINARGGEPELVNIVDLMEDDVDLGVVLTSIATGELRADSIHYKKLASAMLYLVSPDYGYRTGSAYDFTMYPSRITGLDCLIRFAATVQRGPNRYQTVGSSRSVGLTALAPTPWAARERLHAAVAQGFGHPLSLVYRYDVADEVYIRAMAA